MEETSANKSCTMESTALDNIIKVIVPGLDLLDTTSAREQHIVQSIRKRMGHTPPGRLYPLEAGFGDFFFHDYQDVRNLGPINRHLKIIEAFKASSALMTKTDARKMFKLEKEEIETLVVAKSMRGRYGVTNLYKREECKELGETKAREKEAKKQQKKQENDDKKSSRVKRRKCQPIRDEPVVSRNEPKGFMDLPREIRNQIYKTVISSMTLADNGEPPFGTHTIFSLRDPTFHDDDMDRKVHPNRKHHYEISRSRSTSATLNDVDDIRNLANTNSVTRMELAQVLWARTSIEVDSHAIKSLLRFLDDRPAIWDGIKKLKLHLKFSKYHDPEVSYFLPSADISEVLPEICAKIRSMLQLESLELNIVMSAKDVELLFEQGGQSGWFESIRSLHVSHRFSMDLSAAGYTYDHFEGDLHEHVQRVENKIEERLKAEICPNSLRPVVE